jgi:hypothetical protein
MNRATHDRVREFYKGYGQRLLLARLALGYSTEQMGAIFAVKAKTYECYEGGAVPKNQSNYAALHKLYALGFNYGWLLEGGGPCRWRPIGAGDNVIMLPTAATPEQRRAAANASGAA